tara:strand:- start:2065 stop:2562 length:498 start_codon:yes stop_codon:yes gene_type:complete
MKKCTLCKKDKEFSSFHKRKAVKDGCRSACIECEKELAQGANKEKIQKYTESYNRAKGCKSWSEYLEDKRRNPIPHSFGVAKRRAQKKNAEVSWADKQYMQDLYRNAKEANTIFEAVGLLPRFQVDHIVPLQHKTACGLHVEYNLQIVPRSWNLEKGNKSMAIYC